MTHPSYANNLLMHMLESERDYRYMPNTTVTLMRRCQTKDGWKYYPVFMGKKGRVKPEYALVNGRVSRL